MLNIGQVVEALRREGFIIWSDKNALILTGEPTIAVTFMDMAAKAGILSPALEPQLRTILRSANWLRAESRDDVLRSIPPHLPLFARVESPG